jgi:glycosyltransferase involved in cell wall biosynthesis
VREPSAQKLGEAIVATLDNADLRERMGRLGHERLHGELNWEKSVTRLLEAYEEALK